MAEQNFARLAIAEVKAELRNLQLKRGKKVPKPTNPVAEFYKAQGINLSDLR